MNGAGIDGEKPGWLLALHSSSDTLGVGLSRLGPVPLKSGLQGGAEGPGACLEPERLAAFPLGRSLSNQLLECVESVLPAADWSRLRRLSVATGPGGFTGTRLTVVLARTLAQQLALPLDGVSSFQLIARRLWQASLDPTPFWLVQSLPRRGVVAGRYAAEVGVPGGIAELQAPRLYASGARFEGACHPAEPQLPEDVAQLLAISQARWGGGGAGLAAPWEPVLPLYPTSPVAEG